ncbi:hypothetical protein MFIFM68171_04860 [Madurella fahalii]|uniref:Uncharacterized protein n=1 Tax=Madurella fahalii TaxID=1157608 RepID=A0ABQ0GAC9_9PEZI
MTRDGHPTETRPRRSDQALELRADATGPPELCGFHERTSSVKCPSGQTCKFNTDLYAVGCCSDDLCDWRTSCCDYNPSPATASIGTYIPSCGGPVPELIAYCINSDYPVCGTNRWENGFTQYYCARNPVTLVNSVLFTSAGEATARPGLPRLTGSNGPGSVSTQASAVTVRVTETATSGPSPGVIAGSVVGGAALGVIATLLAVFLSWHLRQKKARSTAMAQNNTTFGVAGPTVRTNISENTQSPYETGWDASGRHELLVSRVQGQERQELPAKTT